MHVVSEQRKEAIDTWVDLAAQTVLDAFADHRTLLARDRQQVGLVVGQDGLAQADIEILQRPILVPSTDVAQFQVACTKTPCDLLGLSLQRIGRSRIAGRHTAVIRERQAHQRVAKQQALDLGQRQHALDAAVALRIEEMGRVTEDLVQHPLPACAVEKGRLRTAQHKGVPARRRGSVAHRQLFDHQHRLGRHHRRIGNQPAA